MVPAGIALAQLTEPRHSLVIEGPSAVEFPENSTTAIATYRVTNAASDSTISWSIDGTDARRLSIDDSGVLRFTVARNFERPNDSDRNNEYEIELSAVAGSTYVSVEVIVRVTDVNEPPAFELESAEFSIEENTSANRRVGGALAVIDPDDGDSSRFSLEEERADLFYIDTEGQIRVRPGAVLDYETVDILSLTAHVTDRGGLSDSLPVQIQLIDADDQGVVTFSSAKPFIGAPFDATVSDDDGVTGRIRWRWHRAMDTNDEFERIDGATRSSYTPVEDDEGYILRATVSYEDNFEVGASASEISAAVAKNTAPQFKSASITLIVPEEAPARTNVGDPVSATDSDGQDLTYTLSGEDESYFVIDDLTGQISVRVQGLPDSETETSYTVIVTATDTLGATVSVTVVIKATVSNTRPTIDGPLDVDYTEDSTTSVATYSAMDPEGDEITWGVAGPDASRFTISAAGELTFNSPPDYEKPRDANEDNVYEMTVMASDGNLESMLDVTVTVTDIAEAIPITGPATVSYPENGTAFVTTYSATDPEGDEITWGVAGADASRFTISAAGELTFNSPPDYEKPRDANNDNVYEVTVTVSDGNLTAELDAEITVTNVNEAVSISGSTSVTYTENGTTTISVYSTTNFRGNEITWNLRGADAARFSINEMGELMFNSPPDYEKPRDANNDNVYEVTVTASDGNLTAELDAEITVTNVNEAVSISGSTSVTYTENSTTGVAVYSATDPDGDAVTWSISGADASRFSIKETGELMFNSPPDYEKPRDANNDNVYEVMVTASDGGLTSTLGIEITVANVVEALIIAGPDAVSYTENGTASVAMYMAADSDGDGIIWDVVGTDASRFSIEETGELLFNSASDYEKPRDANKDNVYEVTVTALDGNLTAKLDVEVTVTNVNEVASIDGSTFVTYAENDTTTVAVYSATDPDGDGITWGIEGTDAARFQISAAGELSFDSPPNYEKPRDANKDNVYEVTVAASDGNLTAKLDVEVNISNVNEAASIGGLASVTYSENNTDTVAIYSATDSEGDGIAWSIEGMDAAQFSISEVGGLSFKSPPNYERPSDANRDNVYEVTVTSSDGNLKSTLDVELTVTDVNEPASITGPVNLSYVENSAIAVAVYFATDPESDEITWDIAGTDAARFTIGETGELLFNSSPDYENPEDTNKDNVYEVTVIASDGTIESTLEVEITVADAAETILIAGPAIVTCAENGTASVATYTALDPDGSGIMWEVVGTDAARLSITTGGELAFNSPPDYEKPSDDNKDNVYEVTITASGGNLTSTLDVEVTVMNVNEVASITGPVSASYMENGKGTVAKYTLVDPDGGDDGPTGWEVVGADAAHFVIDNQGRLAFVLPPNFENPVDVDVDNTYLLRIVKNSDGTESGLDVTVEVTDVNDAPRFPSKAIVTEIPENSCPGAYTIYRGIGDGVGFETDEDGDSLTYALSGQDERIFVIHPPSGYVTLSSGILLDFETAPKSFLLRVSVSDGRDDLGDAESEFTADDYLDLTVMVSDVDEPPVFTEAQLIRDACGTLIRHESDQLRRTVTAGVRGGSRVGAALSVIDPERKPVHFRIVSQSDPGAFIVDSKTGQIMVAPGFSPRDARRVYILRVAAMDGKLESHIEVRIAVRKAPKPTPEPDVEDTSTLEPVVEDSPTSSPASVSDPEVSETVQSDEISGDPSPLGGSAMDSAHLPSTLDWPLVNLERIEPIFVPVPRAVQTPIFGDSEVQDQTGRVRLTAPAGTLAVPYQVRLTQDEAACVSLNETAPPLDCVCVSVEFFDIAGEPLVQEFLNRPALLEIILRTQNEAENSGSGDERAKISRDSVESMMRQDDKQEWAYIHGDLREPADGSSILMIWVRSPGQYMALVTESRADKEDLGSAAPLNSVKVTSIHRVQKTAKKSVLRRTVSFVYDPVAVHPEPEPTPLVSTEPQIWYMARLMIALLLDVTVALYVGFLLQRLTFRQR